MKCNARIFLTTVSMHKNSGPERWWWLSMSLELFYFSLLPSY